MADGQFQVPTPKIPDRIWNKLTNERMTGCWLWQGYVVRNGYGQVRMGKSNRYVHRVVYELLKGPIPDGLTLDHLCRIRRCANPEHLEPVTGKENCLRGESFSAANHRKTHCSRNHPLSGDNLVMCSDGQRRDCRECRRIRGKKSNAKLSARGYWTERYRRLVHG